MHPKEILEALKMIGVMPRDKIYSGELREKFLNDLSPSKNKEEV